MKKGKIALLITAVFFVAFAVNSGIFAADNSKSETERISWTISFLKKQENMNVDDVETEINKVNKDTSIFKFDMSKAKSRFEDVVFLGDSITEYLREANLLNAASVLAQKGEHVNQASKHLEELKNLKPSEIVILYGANDISSSSPEKYKEEYVKLINSIKKELPNVRIFVQAPFPVYEAKASSRDSRVNNENIKRLTVKAREAAYSTGSRFLSSDGLITSLDVYEQDGIHFKYEFYKNWLFYLSENL